MRRKSEKKASSCLPLGWMKLCTPAVERARDMLALGASCAMVPSETALIDSLMTSTMSAGMLLVATEASFSSAVINRGPAVYPPIKDFKLSITAINAT